VINLQRFLPPVRALEGVERFVGALLEVVEEGLEI